MHAVERLSASPWFGKRLRVWHYESMQCEPMEIDDLGATRGRLSSRYDGLGG